MQRDFVHLAFTVSKGGKLPEAPPDESTVERPPNIKEFIEAMKTTQATSEKVAYDKVREEFERKCAEGAYTML